jgi:hypothetical protein
MMRTSPGAFRVLSVPPHVLARELVDVLPGTLAGDFDNAASDLDVAVRVGMIRDREGDSRVAREVAGLLPSFGGVNQDMAAIVVYP